MKYAADFRAIARQALRGRWLTTALSAFITALIGAQISSGGGSGGSSSLENDSIHRW